MPARKMDLEQIAEQIHALAFDALDRRAYATAAALCRTLSELDGVLAVREMQRDAEQHDQAAVHVPMRGATRPEYPRHGHLAIRHEGQACSICGTAGVAECPACLQSVPGSVREAGGSCGKCGTSYILASDVPPPEPVRDAAKGAATSVSWLRGVRRGRRHNAGTPWAGDAPAQDGDWPGPTSALTPGAPGLGDAQTQTMPAVPADDREPLDYCERCGGYRPYVHTCDKPTPEPY